jgi:hypothetical protein
MFKIYTFSERKSGWFVGRVEYWTSDAMWTFQKSFATHEECQAWLWKKREVLRLSGPEPERRLVAA